MTSTTTTATTATTGAGGRLPRRGAPPTAAGGAGGGVGVVMLPLARVRAHPRNVRRELGDLRGLAGSIRAQGVLVPLLVTRRGEFFELLAGHRRAAAASLAGRTHVPALVLRGREADEAIALMLTENLTRTTLSARETRAAVAVLVDQFGHTPAGVAAKLGVSPATVSHWLRTHDHAHDNTQDNASAAVRARPARCSVSGRARAPRIAPTAIHHLRQRWAGRAPAGLLAELAGLLDGWAPTPPSESVNEHVLAQVGELDPQHSTPIPQLAARLGVHPKLVERARRALRTTTTPTTTSGRNTSGRNNSGRNNGGRGDGGDVRGGQVGGGAGGEQR